MDGYNILTDPIFSTRTIGNWFGPKRLRPPPCKLSELPRVDIVLVSHDHYDHLGMRVGCFWGSGECTIGTDQGFDPFFGLQIAR